MSGHTPGPWKVDPNYPIDVQTADGKREICTPFYEEGRGKLINPVTPVALYGEACANARLIAAAPELLESAESVIAAWGKFLSSFDYVPGIGDTAEDLEFREMLSLRAAIAKAKGADQ